MDYLQRVKDRETELDSLRKRQDADKNLLYLTKYVMADADNKAVPNIINVTLNRPAVLAANIIASLGKVSEQRLVSSDKASIDTHYIEAFIKASLAMANDRLSRRSKPKINPFFDEQVSIRGSGSAFCVFQMVDGILVPDIRTWDTRYVTTEMDMQGLIYACYTTMRRRSDLEVEYIGKVKGTTTRMQVRDIWDKTHNEVWIENEKVFEQGHSYGYVPVVYEEVPLGSQLADEDAEAHHGESIFFLIRTVIPEFYRLASIMTTLNLKAVKAPMKAKKKGAGEPPEYEDVTGLAEITAMEPDEDIAPIDYGDAKRAAEIAYKMFDQALSEGSLPPEAYGSIDIDLSGVALIELGERSGAVIVPRLETKASLNTQLANMLIRQCIQIGGSIEVGTPGHKRSFDTEKLKGEYDVNFTYFPKSPKLDMARYSMAAQAKTVAIPQRTIDEEILQVEDPDGRERMRRWEEAERLFPSIKIQRTLRSLIGETPKPGDDDADFEAELAAMEAQVNLQSMMKGEVTQQPKVEELPKPNPLMLGTGIPSIGTSAKKASDIQLSPLEATKGGQ